MRTDAKLRVEGTVKTLVDEFHEREERHDRAHDDERPADRGIERDRSEPAGILGCTRHVPFVPSRAACRQSPDDLALRCRLCRRPTAASDVPGTAVGDL